MFLRGAIAAVCAVVAYWLIDSQVLDAPHPCPRPDSLAVNVTTNPSCYFSDNYFAARALFRANIDGLTGWERHSLQVVQDDDLTIDVAILRRSPRKLVLHVSGTHGVEGFAGSAIQNAFLTLQRQQTQAQNEGEEGSDESDSEKPTIVLVHVLNPFGVANYRRWNEDNVDLNRNALFTPEEWSSVQARDPNIARYEDMNPYYNPAGRPTSWGFWSRLLPLFVSVNFDLDVLKRAAVTGTYTNHKGIFYGGQGLSKSHQLLQEFLDKQGLLDSVERLVLVDVHTGLGPHGVDTLLVDRSLGHDMRAIFANATRTQFGARLPNVPAIPFDQLQEGADNADVDDVSKGYDLVVGSVGCAYASLFRNVDPRQVISVTQEFGTQAGFFVLKSLVEENQAFHSDLPLEQQLPMRLASRRAFDVNRHTFQWSVVTRGLDMLHQAQQHLLESY